jgi:hypothetical protein
VSAPHYRPERDVVLCAGSRQPRDRCTQYGAQSLAWQLDAWWHDRGYPQVRHWVERAKLPKKSRVVDSEDGEAGLFVVRSNLVAGMPPQRETGKGAL